jgi:hypothetical protein
MSRKGERAMSTLSAVASGFDVGAAHRIVAHMTLFSPTMPTGKTCVFKVTFDPASASPPKAMVGTISRDLGGGGTESNSVAVSAKTAAEVVIPLGAFPGRRVSYTVDDVRTLTMKIRSLNNYGVNEVWHLELDITVDPTDVTDFQLRAGAKMSIDSVDVTP